MRTIRTNTHFAWTLTPIIAILLIALISCLMGAQAPIPGQPNVFGIYVDPAGSLQFREKDASAQLAQLRARSTTQPSDANLHYLSLPKLFAEVRATLQAHKPLPTNLQYLHGLTQIRYLFLYPNENDLVIAGPAEPFSPPTTLQPLGKLSARPLLHLDDLVTALRIAHSQNPPQPFGCSIDPPDHSVQTGQEILKQYANRPRNELADALALALGPQQIRFFGTPPDSRTAFVCAAADYKLKRLSIGLDPPPLPGLGNSIDNSRPAGNAFWFETLYQPLLVSPDSTAYAIRGPRLQLKTGHVPFDEKGATPKAQAYAKLFSAKLPLIAAATPIYADLQNIADLSLLANLIRQDNLAQRANLDLTWLLDDSLYHTQSIPIPRSTDTLVNYTNGSLAAGGVSLSVAPYLSPSSRQIDTTNTLTPLKQSRPKP